jgi:hypothetical protein
MSDWEQSPPAEGMRLQWWDALVILHVDTQGLVSPMVSYFLKRRSVHGDHPQVASIQTIVGRPYMDARQWGASCPQDALVYVRALFSAKGCPPEAVRVEYAAVP